MCLRHSRQRKLSAYIFKFLELRRVYLTSWISLHMQQRQNQIGLTHFFGDTQVKSGGAGIRTQEV